jgi:hypothetical protein
MTVLLVVQYTLSLLWSCCVVLCCVVLCCVVLRCVALCCVVLCCVRFFCGQVKNEHLWYFESINRLYCRNNYSILICFGVFLKTHSLTNDLCRSLLLSMSSSQSQLQLLQLQLLQLQLQLQKSTGRAPANFRRRRLLVVVSSNSTHLCWPSESSRPKAFTRRTGFPIPRRIHWWSQWAPPLRWSRGSDPPASYTIPMSRSIPRPVGVSCVRNKSSSIHTTQRNETQRNGMKHRARKKNTCLERFWMENCCFGGRLRRGRKLLVTAITSVSAVID